jgi:hypothetical protein
MMKRTSTTTRTPERHAAANPYRINALSPSCTTCGAAALLACPGCGRPYCGEHANLAGACMDCEIDRPRLSCRAETLTWTLATLGSLAGGWCLVSGLAFWGTVLLPGTLLTAATLAWIARRAARRAPKGSWTLVENAHLTVAATAGEDPHRRLGAICARNYRARDMYTVAYNAGFNRLTR